MKSLLEGTSVLVNTNHTNKFHLYQMLAPLNRNTVCLTLKRPAENLKNMLEPLSMNINFIDGISHHLLEPKDSHLRLKNPADHEEIMNKIELALSRTPTEKTLIIDSIDNLANYQSEAEVMSLLRFVVQRTKQLGITTFVLNNHKNLSPNFITHAHSACDEMITLP